MAVVTYTRSPQTMGLECARPGIAAVHRMFSPVATFHEAGRFWPSTAPDAFGPRKLDQFGSGVAASVAPSTVTARVIGTCHRIANPPDLIGKRARFRIPSATASR